MIKRSPTLPICFRGLCHPITLLSIFVLVINDHLLKFYCPSMLTGKLSDFAGLFFFPFLLAAILSIFMEGLGLKSHKIGGLAFWVTALGFTLIKIHPASNALVEQALTPLLGMVRISRDPTDLIALSILWPAWRLWLHVERPLPSKFPERLAHTSLIVAAIASIASICAPYPTVERLVVDGHIVYTQSISNYHSTSEDGMTWEQYPNTQLPDYIQQAFQEEVQLPLILCMPDDQQSCYRISGEEIVEETIDGGETWDIVWQVPFGRRHFIDRLAESSIFTCGKDIDLGPYDMVLLEVDGTQRLIIAMGNEGVLVRSEEGEFSRHRIGQARPTPYAKLSIEPIFNETLILSLISLITLLGFSFDAWNKLLKVEPPERQRKGLRTWFAIFAIIVFLLGASTAYIMVFVAGLIVLPIFYLLILIMLLATWFCVKRAVQRSQVVRNLIMMTFILAILAFLAGWLPLILWTIGWIPIYGLSLGIAVILLLITLIKGRSSFLLAWQAMNS
jgi:hypothetical protein